MARLLSNKILLQAGHPILIITRESKEEYIRALKLFHNDSAEYLVAFFYQCAIRRMQKEIEEKKAEYHQGHDLPSVINSIQTLPLSQWGFYL